MATGAPAIAAWLLTLCVSVPTYAQDTPLPSVSVGAGARTSFVHTQVDEPDDEESTFDGTSDRIFLDSARIYLSGSATKNIKFLLNTEFESSSNEVQIMDAVARLEFSPGFNIWAGRFLPPSDRANLYGPYYAHHWNVYQDGVQDGYPFIFQGRANGAAYWGQYGIFKVSAGVFVPRSHLAGSVVICWSPDVSRWTSGIRKMAIS
jgi:hypothetical protein